ncbi:MAG: hypothetical protein H7Y09_11145 [Chitinophagaceae bacterium]|nr:hypothetical protein [Anaerolineae bacterium]
MKLSPGNARWRLASTSMLCVAIAGGFIALVDINAAVNNVEYIEVPVEEAWRVPTRSVLSPDGVWFAFASALESETGQDPSFVRLFNLVSGEIRDIQSDALKKFTWSPDSRFLAFSQGYASGNDIFLYSLESETTLNLMNDGRNRHYLAWSPDSQKIATISQQCITSEDCSLNLDVINVAQSVRESSVNLVVTLPEIGFGYDPKWSPDGRYVSFVKKAPLLDSSIVPAEVLIWDTQNRVLTQATHFTSAAFEDGRYGLADASYTTFWHDRDTLLIGASYWTDATGTRFGTYVYEVGEDLLTPLFDTFLTNGAQNPTNNQIAGRFTTIDPANSPESRRPDAENRVTLFTLDAAEATNIISQIDVMDITTIACFFSWSPDGSVFVYHIPVNFCFDLTSEDLVIVDAATGTYQEFSLPLPEGVETLAVIPLGWVAR